MNKIEKKESKMKKIMSYYENKTSPKDQKEMESVEKGRIIWEKGKWIQK